MKFAENDRIILIGDSITDAGRRNDPEQVGDGYFRLIRDYYITNYPHLNLNFINKGIGGNRVTDLKVRWEEDVLNLQPQWVSVSIGVNDVWRQLDNPDIVQVYPEDFKQIYTEILEILQQSTQANIILMEPSIIEEDIHSEGNQLLKDYVKIVRDLTKQFHAILVPTHDVFTKFLQQKTDYALTTDGVHMSSVGNMLMAKTWIEAVLKKIN